MPPRRFDATRKKFQSWQFSVGLSTHRTNAQILLRLKLERGTDHEVPPLAKVNSSHHNRKQNQLWSGTVEALCAESE
jgi:hypothetical protein